MSIIRIGNQTLDVLEHPEYQVAHPGEMDPCSCLCTQCLLVVRRDTGEIILLWGSGNNYGLSRQTPNYKRHRKELFPVEGVG